MANSGQIEREKEYWTNLDEFEWLSEEGVRDVVALLPQLRGDVLELCSGSGMFTRHVSSECQSYVCLDLSSNLLKTLAGNMPHIDAVQGNAEDPPFAEGSFDAILIFAGLHHLTDIRKAVVNAYRLLRPGGLLVGFEPNNKCWYRRFMFPLRRVLGVYTEDEVFLDPESLVGEVSSAGFAVDSLEFVTPRYNLPHYNFFNRLLIVCIMIAASARKREVNQTFFVVCARKS